MADDWVDPTGSIYLTDPKKSLRSSLPLRAHWSIFDQWGIWKDGYTYCKYCKMYAPNNIQYRTGYLRKNPAAHEEYKSEFCTSKKAIAWRTELYSDLDKKNKAQREANKARAKKQREANKAKAKKQREAKKRRKIFLSDEKERKLAAFNNRIFQPGFRTPPMSKKELAWNETDGKCKLCRSYKIQRELGFWWLIHPTLEVVLLCKKCAQKEGLFIENNQDIVRSRKISEEVKDSVWNRDGGKCVQCGSKENLEFDHIIPFSKGGANTKRNIQLLCESCNRAKSDNIG